MLEHLTRRRLITAGVGIAALGGLPRGFSLLGQGVAASAAEVNVMAGVAMRGIIGELGPQFEHATGHKIAIQYGPGLSVKRQIEAGEAFDLVIIGSDVVDDLIKQGRIAADSRVEIVRVGIVVVVREGAPKPDISSVDAFKRTLLSEIGRAA